MKKIINNIDDIILEELQGMQKAHGDIIKVNYEPMYVKRANQGNKVVLVSGGGSGHEPLHAGFVGYGMLDIACLVLYLLLLLLIKWKRLLNL